MFSKLFKKDTNSVEEIILKRIKWVLEESLKINYMILTKRTLLITEKTFVDLYSNFVLDSALVDKSLLKLQNKSSNEKNSGNVFLQELKNRIESKDSNFIYNIKLPENLLKKFLHVKNIDTDYDIIWDIINQNDDIDAMEKSLEEKYSNLDKSTKEKIKKSLKAFNNLNNFRDYVFTVKENFIILNVGDFQEVYSTRENLYLSNIKDISYYVQDKSKYSINILWDDFFNYKKEEIEHYKSNRIYGLNEVRNNFLMTWLCNNMTSYDFWDLNITYFYGDPLNPHKINASVRHKWKYKIINYKNLRDFDLNILDSDIITLGWKLSWVVTVTNLKVGRFSYRVLIMRKNGIYFLNIRKTEWIPYTVKELIEKSWVNVNKYIIEDGKENKNVKLDTDYSLKHFDIDFPLGYSDNDTEVFFSKLISASKGTFWINGKTNSWKSTSLKNLIKRFYEFSRNDLGTNKNILMIENPIEWYDYYLKQIEVDDEDIDDYKAIIMGIKRADLDMCIFWELRTYDVFGIFNEISNSLPVFSTFHVGTAESFLSILKYYADKAGLNHLDIFWNVNVSLIQIPLEAEVAPEESRNYFAPEEKDELIKQIYARFRLNEVDLTTEEMDFKTIISDLITLMFDKGYYPIKSYAKGRYKLNYEILTWDMLSMFLAKKETNFGDIYKYLGYTNNMLYKTFMQFVSGEMIFENVKLDEYSHDVKIKTLQKVKEYLLSNDKPIWENK